MRRRAKEFADRQAGQPALRLAGLSAYGQKNRMAAQGADLIDAESVDEILHRLAEHDKKRPGAEWLFGNGYDESVIGEGRPPNIHENVFAPKAGNAGLP